MAISLSKSQKVDLTKTNPGVVKWYVGAGWDVAATPGTEFDLDLQAVLLKADGKVGSDSDFVFYGNKSHASGAAEFGPDNRTGEGNDRGYDEIGTFDLSKVPADIESIELLLSIYDAENRGQTFGMVSNTRLAVHKGTDAADAEELNVKVSTGSVSPEVSYDPSEDYSMDQGVKVGKFYRHNGEWKFQAIGEGFNKIVDTLRSYGINVG